MNGIRVDNDQKIQMEKSATIAYEIAKFYMEACEKNLSQADVLGIFRSRYPGRHVQEFGYKGEASFKAAVSKVLIRCQFSKSTFARRLVATSLAKFECAKSKNDLQQLICQDLHRHI